MEKTKIKLIIDANPIQTNIPIPNKTTNTDPKLTHLTSIHWPQTITNFTITNKHKTNKLHFQHK